MNGMLSAVATIERIATIEAELKMLRADAFRRAGIPLPSECNRMGRITELASVVFGIPQSVIFGECRIRRIARCRFAIIWVAHQAHGLSSTTIGRALGHRDHSTVLNGLNRAEQERETDPEFRELTDELLALVVPRQPVPEEAENAGSSH